MKLTPGQKHKARIQAERAAEAAQAARLNADPAAAANSDASLRLLDDAVLARVKAVSAIPQGVARVEAKKRALLEFLPHVDELLTSNAAVESLAFFWCMIWSADVGDIATLMRLGQYATARNLMMPAPFGSTYSVKQFLADQIIDWATVEVKNDRSTAPYFDDLYEYIFVKKWAVHDITKAKYHKQKALILESEQKFATALEEAKKAEEIAGQKAMVKTLIARLTKAIAAMEE